MNKKAIALIFSILFVALISAPSIISAIDDSVDISILYSITEEENENFKLTLPDSDLSDTEKVFASNTTKQLEYRNKKYSTPHLNLSSPPPEVNM
ncbi:hypothetical protein [Pontimicrobium aquaticum]|uniref:Uncharacterized protein n=1 Tax=Pontimicrobium aquaticum TaxID=2565367 RepID=A0A4U0F156_9FLAO|nr:hypothetical protein [Pontimicrobium aquaticum]TJY38165.1 hypothetical protein E5167_02610 [Pontimicrobium aquaticum]